MSAEIVGRSSGGDEESSRNDNKAIKRIASRWDRNFPLFPPTAEQRFLLFVMKKIMQKLFTASCFLILSYPNAPSESSSFFKEKNGKSLNISNKKANTI